jgi:hypothetical protein
MDEFEQMWKTSSANGEAAAEEQEIIEETPEYLIRDGIARMKILADMLINYYHAKYGEPLQVVTQDTHLEFHLD